MHRFLVILLLPAAVSAASIQEKGKGPAPLDAVLRACKSLYEKQPGLGSRKFERVVEVDHWKPRPAANLHRGGAQIPTHGSVFPVQIEVRGAGNWPAQTLLYMYMDGGVLKCWQTPTITK
jgi:hypothetical protein